MFSYSQICVFLCLWSFLRFSCTFPEATLGFSVSVRPSNTDLLLGFYTDSVCNKGSAEGVPQGSAPVCLQVHEVMKLRVSQICPAASLDEE